MEIIDEITSIKGKSERIEYKEFLQFTLLVIPGNKKLLCLGLIPWFVIIPLLGYWGFKVAGFLFMALIGTVLLLLGAFYQELISMVGFICQTILFRKNKRNNEFPCFDKFIFFENKFEAYSDEKRVVNIKYSDLKAVVETNKHIFISPVIIISKSRFSSSDIQRIKTVLENKFSNVCYLDEASKTCNILGNTMKH